MAEDTGLAPAPTSSSGPPAPDYAGLQRNYLMVQSSAGRNMADLDAAFAMAQTAAGAKAGAAGAVAQAQIGINNVVETAAIKFKKDNAAAASSFGTNPDASTYVIHDMGAKLRQSALDEEGKRAELEALVNTSFFDNPLDWLMAQVSAPFQAASLEIAEGRTKRLAVNLKALQDLTLDQFKVNAAVDEASSTELLAAKNKMALAQAAGAAAASQAELARLGIDKINMRMHMDNNQLESTFKFNNQVVALQTALRQERDEELRGDRDLRAKEAHDMSMRLHRVQLEIAEGKDSASKDLQSRLDVVSPMVGLGRMDVNTFMKIPNNDPTKMLISSLLYSVDAAQGRLASSPARAYEVASLTGNRLPGGQEMVRAWMGDIHAKTVKGEEQTWKNMAPDVREQKLNERYVAAAKSTLASIPETGTPYSPPPLAKVLDIPAYADNIFAKALAPLANNPSYATKPEDFLVAAMDMLKNNTTADGRIDARLASVLANNIAFIFDGIIVDTNVRGQFGKFVLPGLSKETGYNMQVRDTGLLNTTRILDMSNSSAITAYLIRRMVTERSGGLPEDYTPKDVMRKQPPTAPARRTQ